MKVHRVHRKIKENNHFYPVCGSSVPRTTQNKELSKKQRFSNHVNVLTYCIKFIASM